MAAVGQGCNDVGGGVRTSWPVPPLSSTPTFCSVAAPANHGDPLCPMSTSDLAATCSGTARMPSQDCMPSPHPQSRKDIDGTDR